MVLLIIGLGLGVAVGFALGGAGARAARSRLQAERDAARNDVTRLTAESAALSARVSSAEAQAAQLTAALDHERTASAQRLLDLQKAQTELTDTFRLLSQEALDRTSTQLLALTDQRLATAEKQTASELEQRKLAVAALVKPIEDHLQKVATQIDDTERRRTREFSTLGEQLRTIGETGSLLRQETEQLKNALRRPEVRGAWGELQLKRVVELAGMVEHCDFVVQETVTGDNGRLRPDLVVRLAGGKNLVVDSKVSLGAYFDALNATDDTTRTERLAAHARHVRTHIDQLAAKAYWEHLSPTPEFVIAFVPGEAMLAQALETDPSLIEHAAHRNVLLASPVTLIAMLRATSYGWKETKLAENAQKVFDEGRGLYKRLSTMGDHLEKLGRSLTGSVKAYNQAIGSLERQVLPSARRLKDLHVTDATLVPPTPVDEPVRLLTASELVASADEGRPVRMLPRATQGNDSAPDLVLESMTEDPRFGLGDTGTSGGEASTGPDDPSTGTDSLFGTWR